jgi:hypothetical protein
VPNRTLVKSASWANSLFRNVSNALDGMVQEYSLEDLYPYRERRLEDGSTEEYREILPHQRKFHEKVSPSGLKPDMDRTWFQLFSGGYGCGKTLCVCVDILYYIRKYPGVVVWSILPYFYYIEEFLWPTLRSILPDDSPLIERINQKDGVYYFRNGAIWHFKGVDDPQKVKGWEGNIIHIGEASELGGTDNQKGKQIYFALQGRLRAQGNVPRMMLVEQNPNGHNWVWAVFLKESPMRSHPKETWMVKPEDDWVVRPDGSKRKRGYGCGFSEYERIAEDGSVYYTISAGSLANTKLPKGVIENMLANYSSDPHLIQRMVMGSFEPLQVLVFGEPHFVPSKHVIDLERVADVWQWNKMDAPFPECCMEDFPLVVGIDTAGASSPWAIEFFIEAPDTEPGSPSSHLIGIGEIYVKGIVWQDIADRIKEFTRGWRDVRYWVDPISSRQREGPNLTAMIDEFAHFGIPCDTPLNFRVQSGYMHVHSLLKCDQTRPHPYLDDAWDEREQQWEIGAPSLMFLKGDMWKEGKDAEGFGKDNPEGWAQYALRREMELYRFDTRKQREQKEWEEGLTPEGPQKVIPRDDHAISALYFATMGWKVPVKMTPSYNKILNDRKPLYSGHRKRPGRGRVELLY